MRPPQAPVPRPWSNWPTIGTTAAKPASTSCDYIRKPDPASQALGGNSPIEIKERRVKHTIFDSIGERLRVAPIPGRTWHGHDFDFTGATIDDANLCDAKLTGGTVDFTDVTLPGGTLNLAGMAITGGTLNFRTANLTGGALTLDAAKFNGGIVDFDGARIRQGEVHFRHADFNGGTFRLNVQLTGGTVDFHGAQFRAGAIDLESEVDDGTLNFGGADFDGADVNFEIGITGGTVGFRRTKFSGGIVKSYGSAFLGGDTLFNEAQFRGASVSFTAAEFTSGTVSFRDARFSGGEVTFHAANFNGATVDFRGAKVDGGTVDLPHISNSYGPPHPPKFDAFTVTPPPGLKLGEIKPPQGFRTETKRPPTESAPEATQREPWVHIDLDRIAQLINLPDEDLWRQLGLAQQGVPPFDDVLTRGANFATAVGYGARRAIFNNPAIQTYAHNENHVAVLAAIADVIKNEFKRQPVRSPSYLYGPAKPATAIHTGALRKWTNPESAHKFVGVTGSRNSRGPTGFRGSCNFLAS